MRDRWPTIANAVVTAGWTRCNALPSPPQECPDRGIAPALYWVSLERGGQGYATAVQPVDPIRAAGNRCHFSFCATDLGLVGRADQPRHRSALAALAAVEAGPAGADRSGCRLRFVQ